MNIIFWGTPIFCVPILEKLLKSNHNVLAVITQPDRRRGRGNKVLPSPIKQKALEENLPIYTPVNITKEKDIQAKIKQYNADIFVVVAFGQILPKSVLKLPKYGCWNIHASLLPRWRGAAPIQWSILSGDSETGVGLMAMEEGLDTGAVLLEKKLKLKLLENAEQLSQRLKDLSCNLIIEGIEILEKVREQSQSLSKLNLTKQEDINRTYSYARLLMKEDYLINWNDSGYNIHKQILGLYPNCYTYINSKRLKVLESIPINNKYDEFLDFRYKDIILKSQSIINNNGLIIDIIENIGIIVQTKDVPLLITKVKLEGKKESSQNALIQQLTLTNSQNKLGE